MATHSKNFSTTKESKDVYKLITDWCSFSDINVLDSKVTDTNFKIMGKKTYKSAVKFRWVVALLLFFLGAIMGAEIANYLVESF